MAKYRVVFEKVDNPQDRLSKEVSAKAPDDAVGKTTDFFTKPNDLKALDDFNSKYRLLQVSCLIA
mgnify:CR=1 FL=1